MVQVDFKRLFPRGKASILAACAADHDSMEAAGVTKTPERLAIFLAHLSVESQGFTKTEENLSYTARRLRQVWPKRFTSDAIAQQYARNPEALGNFVYGGRMGNGPQEGYRFRGRGGPQLTGREAYEAVGRLIGLDLAGNPDLAAKPENFLKVAVGFWAWKRVAPSCDRGTMSARVLASRKLWNGGINGLEEVQHEVDRIYPVIKALYTVAPSAEPAAAFQVLRVGDHNNARVGQLQRMLNEKGYHVMVDLDFGGNTRNAVLAFQADNNLPTTGDVDERTWLAFSTAGHKPIAEARATATEADLKAEGNEVVKSADVVQKAALAATALVGTSKAAKEGAEALPAAPTGGALDPLVNALTTVQPLFEPLKGLRDFLADHSALLLGVALLGVWYGVKWVKAARVKEKRTGQAV